MSTGFTNPYDGLHVEVHESALEDRYELHLFMRLEGERQWSEVMRCYPRTPVGAGECKRDAAFIQAMCRRTNAGGAPGSTDWLTKNFYRASQKHDFPEISKDWYLADTMQHVEDPTNIFINPKTGKALVIKEDLYSEAMLDSEIEDLMFEKPDDHHKEYQPEEAAEAEAYDTGRLGNQPAPGADTQRIGSDGDVVFDPFCDEQEPPKDNNT
jgi:hypothetical protein